MFLPRLKYLTSCGATLSATAKDGHKQSSSIHFIFPPIEFRKSSAVTPNCCWAAWTCHTADSRCVSSQRCCRQNLVRLRWALRDHKHRRRLRSVAFGIMQVTSEADVQDRRVGRRIWDSPEEGCIPWVEPRDPHRKRNAAIQRQPSLALAPW